MHHPGQDPAPLVVPYDIARQPVPAAAKFSPGDGLHHLPFTRLSVDFAFSFTKVFSLGTPGPSVRAKRG
jgi:hypothetical protein